MPVPQRATAWHHAPGWRRTFANGGNKPTVVFTDGACVTNPTRDRVGAVGVFFGNGDSRNVGTPLEPSEAQTNQRAELKAIFVALQTLSEVGPSSLTNSSNPVPVSHSPLDLLIPHRQKSGDAETKGDVVVVSDSQYSIDCVTKWCHN